MSSFWDLFLEPNQSNGGEIDYTEIEGINLSNEVNT